MRPQCARKPAGLRRRVFAGGTLALLVILEPSLFERTSDKSLFHVSPGKILVRAGNVMVS